MGTPTAMQDPDPDTHLVNVMRRLRMDAVQKANARH